VASRVNDFTESTKQEALERQHHKCGSCGVRITEVGDAGQDDHPYGETARAHHISHHKHGGSAGVDNCVILCWSCHYTAHEGGRYRTGHVDGTPADFPHYRG